MKIYRSSPGVGFLDTRYLRLDTTNGPLTGNLSILPSTNNTAATITLTRQDVFTDTGDILADLFFGNNDTSTDVAGVTAKIEIVATGSYSGSVDAGTSIDFYINNTVPISLTRVLRIYQDGNIGVRTSLPAKALEINHATGQNLRLTYNDSDGSATNITDLTLSSDGSLNISTSGTINLNDRTLVIGNTDAIQLIVRANATQTANIFQVQNSSSTALMSVTAKGGVEIALTGTANNDRAANLQQTITFDGNGMVGGIGRINTTASTPTLTKTLTNAAAGVWGFLDIGGSNTYAELQGIKSSISKAGTSVVTVYKGISVETPTVSAGSITTAYGLFVNDQTAASTNNFALVTNAGLVVFNEGGVDADVRIEGNNVTDLFKTDAGNDQVELNGGLIVNTTTVNAATYSLLITDNIVHVTYTSTGAVTALTLPTAQVVAGRVLVIKDAAGNAATNTITIDTQGAETIDGAATFVINSNYGAINLYSDGSNWFVY